MAKIITIIDYFKKMENVSVLWGEEVESGVKRKIRSSKLENFQVEMAGFRNEKHFLVLTRMPSRHFAIITDDTMYTFYTLPFLKFFSSLRKHITSLHHSRASSLSLFFATWHIFNSFPNYCA